MSHTGANTFFLLYSLDIKYTKAELKHIYTECKCCVSFFFSSVFKLKADKGSQVCACWDAAQLWLLSVRVLRRSYITLCFHRDFEICSTGTQEQPLWENWILVSTWWLVRRTLVQHTALTAVKSLTTLNILQTQPKQRRASQASHSHKLLSVFLEIFTKIQNFSLKYLLLRHKGSTALIDVIRALLGSLVCEKVMILNLIIQKNVKLNNLNGCTQKDTVLHFSKFRGGKNFYKVQCEPRHVFYASLKFVLIGCNPQLTEHNKKRMSHVYKEVTENKLFVSPWHVKFLQGIMPNCVTTNPLVCSSLSTFVHVSVCADMFSVFF